MTEDDFRFKTLEQSDDDVAVKLPPAIAARVPYAPLPKRYEDAKNALALCNQIDECKMWQDKAAAIASYAKQAGDLAMERMAQRIRARALARMGELLSSMPQAVDRSAILREAGIGRRVGDRAVAIARVPYKKREALIEREPPATVTELEKLGRGRSYRAAQGVTLGRFVAWCREHPAHTLSVEVSEIKRLQEEIAFARAWLNQFESVVTR